MGLALAVRPTVVDGDVVPVEANCAFGDLGDAGWVRQHQLDSTELWDPDVPALGVEWPTVVARRRPLGVGEKRLADVAERDGFTIRERLDRRILTGALTRPCANERS